jgi:electron transfer flavoprotein alpha subunit
VTARGAPPAVFSETWRSGIDGDTSQFIAAQEAGLLVPVQPDLAAPFIPVAGYNIIADPVEFAGALLKELGCG